MDDIILDGSLWTETDDFYSAFLAAVGAPAWHGHNLDALYDSVRGGGINKIEVPYRIRVVGTKLLAPEIRQFLERLEKLIAEIKASGEEVELVLEP